MQAAVAGEEGRAFAVVADEVQRLAESARNATAQISTLVQTIHGETAETAETMGQTIARVVEGSSLAERAGVQMDEATRTGEKLQELVHAIADSCVAQASVSEVLTQRSAELLKRATETQTQLHEQHLQSSRLLENSQNLNASVRLFKLPEVKGEKHAA
jgi:methyl-accepting chemotaxis protein